MGECLPMNETQTTEDIIYIEDETLRAGFTQIPNALLRRPGLSAGAKLTYVGLLSYAWQGSCFPGQERLAADLGLGKRSVIRHLQELQTAGLLIVKRRGLRQTNIYFLPRLPASETPSSSMKCQTDTSRNATSALQEVPQRHKKKTKQEEDTERRRNTTSKSDLQSSMTRASRPRSDHTSHTPTGGERHGPASLADILAERRGGTDKVAPEWATTRRSDQERRGVAARPETGRTRQPTGRSVDVRERRATRRGLPAAPSIRSAIGEFSDEFGDEAPASSVTRALRLLEVSGLSEAGFCAALFQSRSIVRQQPRVRRRLPYLFKVLEQLIGVSGHRAIGEGSAL